MLREQQPRPLCQRCGRLPSRSNGVSALGFTRWHRYCNSCSSGVRRKHKPLACEQCGFQAVSSRQICCVEDRYICQNCNAVRPVTVPARAEATVDATVSDWQNLRL